VVEAGTGCVRAAADAADPGAPTTPGVSNGHTRQVPAGWVSFLTAQRAAGPRGFDKLNLRTVTAADSAGRR